MQCLLTDYPRGWVYLKPARKYYRAIFALMDWNRADTRCREFGTYSRLVDINDAAENLAIKEFIATFNGRNCTLPFRLLDTLFDEFSRRWGLKDKWMNEGKHVAQTEQKWSGYAAVAYAVLGGDMICNCAAAALTLRQEINMFIFVRTRTMLQGAAANCKCGVMSFITSFVHLFTMYDLVRSLKTVTKEKKVD